MSIEWCFILPEEAEELHPDTLAVMRDGAAERIAEAIAREVQAYRRRSPGEGGC